MFLMSIERSAILRSVEVSVSGQWVSELRRCLPVTISTLSELTSLTCCSASVDMVQVDLLVDMYVVLVLSVGVWLKVEGRWWKLWELMKAGVGG